MLDSCGGASDCGSNAAAARTARVRRAAAQRNGLFYQPGGPTHALCRPAASCQFGWKEDLSMCQCLHEKLFAGSILRWGGKPTSACLRHRAARGSVTGLRNARPARPAWVTPAAVLPACSAVAWIQRFQPEAALRLETYIMDLRMFQRSLNLRCVASNQQN